MNAHTHTDTHLWTVALPCSPESPYRALSLRCRRIERMVTAPFTLVTALRISQRSTTGCYTQSISTLLGAVHKCPCSLITRCKHSPTECSTSIYLYYCVLRLLIRLHRTNVIYHLLDINKMKWQLSTICVLFFFLQEGNNVKEAFNHSLIVSSSCDKQTLVMSAPLFPCVYANYFSF